MLPARSHPPSRFSLSLFGAMVFACSVAAGQTQNPPVFRAQTQMVLIPVSVRDKSGAPVRQLAASDFIVLDNGERRSVAVVEEISSEAAPSVGTYGSTAAATGNVTRNSSGLLTILAIDLINTPTVEHETIRRSINGYLAKAGPSCSPTALVALTANGLVILHDFSIQPAALLSGLSKPLNAITNLGAGPTGQLPLPYGAKENLPVKDEQLESQRYADRLAYGALRTVGAKITMAELRELADRMRSWRGRKAILWFSDGLPLDVAVESGEPLLSDTADWEQMLKAFDDTNTVAYPVYVRGPDPIGFTSTFTRPDTTQAYERTRASYEQMSLSTVAAETGGRVCGRGELVKCLRHVRQEAEHYYLLSLYLPANIKVGRHKLQVKTSRRDVRVTARKDFVALPSNPSH